FSFLYWHMEYHVEHHMFPSVPSYNLHKLNKLIKDQLPKPNISLYDAYKEILPTVIKQHKDNNFYITKEIPS
ncbi:MAG TPA: fatty acid desaturase, partial [Flavobacteriaceae bacterium]|nr:fatty acid desaturase [Flavobacteriaceae bacterium]